MNGQSSVEIIASPTLKRCSFPCGLIPYVESLKLYSALLSEWQRLHHLAVSEGVSIRTLAVKGFNAVFSEKGLPKWSRLRSLDGDLVDLTRTAD